MIKNGHSVSKQQLKVPLKTKHDKDDGQCISMSKWLCPSPFIQESLLSGAKKPPFLKGTNSGMPGLSKKPEKCSSLKSEPFDGAEAGCG